MKQPADISEPAEERVLGLDLLRAIAVIWVVVAHGDVIIRAQFPNFPNVWILDAVDLFFVLSGFLIGRIILRDMIDRGHERPFLALRYFWMRRWLRTLPAYFVTLAGCLALSACYPDLMPGFDWRYLLFLQNMWTPHPPFMANAWSLCIEEYFYLFFPLLAILLCSCFAVKRHRAYLFATIFFIIGAGAVRFGLAQQFEGTVKADEVDEWCRKLTPARLDAIAFGTFGALLFSARPVAWTRAAFPAAMAAVGIFYLQSQIPSSYYPKWVIGPVWTPLCTLLFLPLFTRLRSAPLWISATIRHISKYSYSIYLAHYPLVLMPIIFIVRPRQSNAVLLCYAAYFVATMLAAYLLYHIAERPGLEWRKKVSARWRGIESGRSVLEREHR